MHWLFDLFCAGGGFYAGMRYGKYVLAFWAGLKAKFGAVKKVL